MRAVTGVGLALFLSAGALCAQNRGVQPFVQSPFGNVVFPGSSAAQGVSRSFGNVVFPGSGGLRPLIPGSVFPGFVGRPGGFRGGVGGVGNVGVGAIGVSRRRGGLTNQPFAYAVPIFVGGGGFYDNPYLGGPYPGDAGGPPPPAPPQQPNVTVVYPPLQQPAYPSPYAGNDFAAGGAPAPVTQAAQEPAPQEPDHYLIAFKDHTIYSAVAFWVEGDTLHYFTSGTTHNQVSLSLIDKDLTQRLNRESGVDLRLP